MAMFEWMGLRSKKNGNIHHPKSLLRLVIWTGADDYGVTSLLLRLKLVWYGRDVLKTMITKDLDIDVNDHSPHEVKTLTGRRYYRADGILYLLCHLDRV